MRPRPRTGKQNPRVVASLPFVEQLARRVAATMPHSIDIGDLVQDGVIGLIDAAHRFDESRGIKFETFAERRIRGAMIDALRKDAWPRGVRRQRRELEAAREELRRELGLRAVARGSRREDGSDEKRLGRTIVRINTIESTSPLANGENLDESTLPAALIPSEPEQPDTRLREAGNKERVRAAIESLPAREQKVIGALLLPGSHDEADRRRDRRQRVSRLAAPCAGDPPTARGAGRMSMPAAEAAKACAQRDPRVPAEAGMAKADRCDSAASAAVARGRRRRRRVAVYASVSRTARSKSAEPERLGEPAAAALFEEALGIGAGDVTGDEDDAARQRRRRGGDRAVKRHAVDARHLQIADHDRS